MNPRRREAWASHTFARLLGMCCGQASVAVDAPFAGALVPLSAYGKDRRVLSVMIEVNRRLYMDELTGQKTQDFGAVRAAVGRIIVVAAKAAAEAGSQDVCSRQS